MRRLLFSLTVLMAFSVAAATPPKHAVCTAMATPLRNFPDPATCAKDFGITAFSDGAGREKAAELLYRQEKVLRDAGSFSEARNALDCVEVMVGDAEDWRHRYELVRRRGTLAYHDERMSDALHHYECALQIASDHQDRAAIAKSLSNAGSALRRLGDYRNALQFLIKSLEMQRADGQGVSGLTLMNIADVYRKLDDPKQSLRYYRDSIEAHRRNNEPIDAAHNLENMSDVAFDQQDMPQAAQWLEEALDVYRKNRSHKFQLRAYSGLMRIAIERSEFERAYAWRSEASSLADRYDLPIPAPLQLQMARLDRMDGKPDAALARLQSTIAGLSEGDADHVALLEESASAQDALGDLDGAIATLRVAQTQERVLADTRRDVELGWQRSRFEAAERERTIAGLEAENRLRTIQLWLAAMVAAIVFLAILLLSMRRRQRARLADTARQVRHEEELARYQRETDALAEDRNLLQVLLDSREDAVCLLDAEGQLMAANRAARRMLDPVGTSVIGAVLSQCLDEAGRKALASALERMEDVSDQSFTFASPGAASHLTARLTQWEQGDGLIVLALEEAVGPVTTSIQAPASEPVNAIDETGARTDFRRDLVELMLAVVDLWERSSGSNRLELAERSKIWRVNIDDGRLRARSMDRYLSLSKLPQNPRWRDVLRTAYFVMAQCSLEKSARDDLQRRVDAVLGYTRRSALV
jgi:tetratricopeptide (TPR) repeat protein/PAS domain-containing protein